VTRQYLTSAEVRARASAIGLKLRQISDELLDEYIQTATEEVEDYTERIFASAYYDETWRGDDSTTYLVQNYPVLDIVSLSEKTVETTPVVTTLDPTLLVRNDINDLAGRIELSPLDTVTAFVSTNLYTVRYRAGFDILPSRVKHATMLYVAELMQPDFADPANGRVDLVPMSSEQIVELLGKLRRKRFF
jgi:hypothetical protein